MKVLGLTVDVPTCSSAVLMEDGHVLCGTPEERLNREKQSMKFPAKAIEFCLRSRGIRLSDIDAIAISWNPLINIAETTSSRLIGSSRHKGELLYSTPANLLPLLGERPSFIRQTIGLSGRELDVHYITHHDCHAANVFYESGFPEAVILTCDGYGENETLTVSLGSAAGMRRESTTIFPNSLGMFYGTITEYLGYRHDSDEWKVMALGAYGTFDAGLYEKLRALFTVRDDLTVKFRTDLFQFDNALTRGMYGAELVDYLGIPPRGKRDEYLPAHYNLACASQRVFEDVMFELCRKLRGRFPGDHLCLGGGSFMNSVFNGKLAASGIYDHLHIPFAPNDAGGALGAAYYLYHAILGHPHDTAAAPPNSYIGPSYSAEEIERVLKLFKCSYERRDDIEAASARLIADGNVVGWFQGAMEFGERALGNRSILADPRNPASKERVNAVIKFRELYRPFAPAILEEFTADYFEAPATGYATPYMEKVFRIRPERAPLIPSVTHADGTGRLQTVTREGNQRFHALIEAFHGITGVPVLLNTSFNRNGEPIVCSPEDALAVFFGSGLDFLVMDRFLVRK